MKKSLLLTVVLLAVGVYAQTAVDTSEIKRRELTPELDSQFLQSNLPKETSPVADSQVGFDFTNKSVDVDVDKPLVVDEKSLSIMKAVSSFSNTRIEDVYVVSGEITLPSGTSVLLAKKIRFNDNAILRIDPSVKFFKLISLETSVGENCKIIATGKDPGQKGVDLDMFLGMVKCFSLEINTSGAQGATGATGSQGHKGKEASCTGGGAGNGSQGGQGGKGGIGGSGGHVTLAIANSSFPNLITINSKGGPGGPGGSGGQGGPGGAGKSCSGGLWRRGSGNQGPIGPVGPVGEEGIASVPTIKSGETVEGFLR